MYNGNGSPLFEAKWPSKCNRCGVLQPVGAMIGYLPLETKPSCSACHYTYNPWRYSH